MRISKLIGHPLVTDMPMLVVVRKPSTGKLELLERLNRVSIVVAQDSPAIRFVQGQGITDAMRNVARCYHQLSFDFDPVAMALINDLIVEFNKRSDAGVSMHRLLYQPLIHNERSKSAANLNSTRELKT